tara:strand:- start:363 stop:575 length:213 start_codon:yes stop_codon:yes gene_type:complete
MTSEEMGVLFGGISSILAVLIYFTKNLRESDCGICKCKQVVMDGNGNAIKSMSLVRPITIPAVPKNESIV